MIAGQRTESLDVPEVLSVLQVVLAPPLPTQARLAGRYVEA